MVEKEVRTMTVLKKKYQVKQKVWRRKMDYNKMSDSELARIMVSYIGRVENLQGIVGRYLDGNESISSGSLGVRNSKVQGLP